MDPELEILKEQKTDIEHQIEQAEHRETLYKNRIAYLNKSERKKRNHRLITRGAAVESIVPAVKEMNEVEFYDLMEAILRHPSVIHLLPKDGS